MKYCILLFILFLASCQKNDGFNSSAIDALNDNKEVEEYLFEIDSGYAGFRVKPFASLKTGSHDMDSINRILAGQHGIDKGFYKADFDNNGYTDMVVIGGYDSDKEDNILFLNPNAFVIMNFGPKGIKMTNFSDEKVPGSGYPFVPQVIRKDNQSLIAAHTISRNPVTFAIDTVTHILTYKFDRFLEYNPKPVQHKIEKIQFATTGCYGTCPVFQLTIHSDRTAFFVAQMFNFDTDEERDYEKEGFFKTSINKSDYDRLISLLNYIDFEQLEDNYSVNHTDDQTGLLIVTYDGGKTKRINDYGLVGTSGLSEVYKMMFDLRTSQKWIKANEPPHIRLKVMPDPPVVISK